MSERSPYGPPHRNDPQQPYGQAQPSPLPHEPQEGGQHYENLQFNATTPPMPEPKKKKGGCFKWGAIAIAVVLGVGVIGNIAGGGDPENSTGATAPSEEDRNALGGELGAPAAGEDESVPLEHRNALRSAENYLDFTSFSEAGLLEQLTSEYADNYPEDAAQYAMDNIDVDWNAEALESAQNYVDSLHFSQSGLLEQLTSEYADKFTPEQAQYAVDNVDVDYTEEAKQAAASYQELSPMSREELIGQLSSEYADGFTYDQAVAGADSLEW